MRFLLETYTAIRATVGKDFLVGVKLNSADFQKGGFDESESVQVVQKLSEMGIDFIEVSGDNYESPQMLAAKDSTRKREAFFIDYAEKARAVSQAPLIITGGFRFAERHGRRFIQRPFGFGRRRPSICLSA